MGIYKRYLFVTRSTFSFVSNCLIDNIQRKMGKSLVYRSKHPSNWTHTCNQNQGQELGCYQYSRSSFYALLQTPDF